MCQDKTKRSFNITRGNRTKTQVLHGKGTKLRQSNEGLQIKNALWIDNFQTQTTQSDCLQLKASATNQSSKSGPFQQICDKTNSRVNFDRIIMMITCRCWEKTYRNGKCWLTQTLKVDILKPFVCQKHWCLVHTVDV